MPDGLFIPQRESFLVPRGKLRLVQDHPLAITLLGLWINTPEMLGQNLVGNTGDAFLLNGFGLGEYAEGGALECFTGTTEGLRLDFLDSSPLAVATGGTTTFWRGGVTEINPDNSSAIFGTLPLNGSNPFAINMIFTGSTAGDLLFAWNTAGTFRSSASAGALIPGQTASVVQSHAYGSAVRGYSRGAERFSDTTNTAAPSYTAGDSNHVSFSWIASRNSRAWHHLGGIAGRAWSADDVAQFESDPYALVEPDRPFLSMLSSVPPIEYDADFPLGDPALDGDLLGADSADNLGRLVARFGRGFRPFRGARR
jgi:hypothetical protein